MEDDGDAGFFDGTCEPDPVMLLVQSTIQVDSDSGAETNEGGGKKTRTVDPLDKTMHGARDVTPVDMTELFPPTDDDGNTSPWNDGALEEPEEDTDSSGEAATDGDDEEASEVEASAAESGTESEEEESSVSNDAPCLELHRTYHGHRDDRVDVTFEPVGRLGSGKFSHVYLALMTTPDKPAAQPDGEMVAVKVSALDDEANDSAREVAVLRALVKCGCGFVVEFITAFEFDADCGGGSPAIGIATKAYETTLFDSLYNEDPEDSYVQRHRCEVFLNVLEGVKAIHAAGFVHLDLKVENIMLDGDNSVRICDFGVAVRKGEFAPETGITVSNSAPEVILEATVGTPADVFSLGCLLFELCTGSVLFPISRQEPMHTDDPRQATLLHLAHVQQQDGFVAFTQSQRQGRDAKTFLNWRGELDDNVHALFGMRPAIYLSHPNTMSPRVSQLIINMTCVDPVQRYSLQSVRALALKDLGDLIFGAN